MATKWGGHKAPPITLLLCDFCQVVTFLVTVLLVTKCYNLKTKLYSSAYSKDEVTGTSFTWINWKRNQNMEPNINQNINQNMALMTLNIQQKS